MVSATPGYIGSYRLLNVVHTGQQSQIWQAYHDGHGKIYGIKTLASQFSHDREKVAFLRWEYEVGHQLEHERLVRIYEYGYDRGNHFLAMEWFPAMNLKRRIQMGIEEVAHLVPKMIDQAAEGLSFFNHLGWVHCDVKPDNFLVNDDGEVKLIDLALAVRSKKGLGKLLGRKTKVQGTRSYMSPEQIRGHALDQRSDVYGFACTVYELFAGRPPFTGVSGDDLLRKHLRATPPALEAVDPNITPEFAQLVRQGLAKDRAKRPNSVEEFRLPNVFKIPPRPPEESVEIDL